MDEDISRRFAITNSKTPNTASETPPIFRILSDVLKYHVVVTIITTLLKTLKTACVTRSVLDSTRKDNRLYDVYATPFRSNN
jgi:hypothetical protein